MMNDTCSILLMVLQCVYTGLAQIAVYEINIGDLHKMQKGVGWPDTLNVFVGHEALLRLTSFFDNMEGCRVTMPDGTEFDVRQPPSNKYEVWSAGCGVRVKNVVPGDAGRWRLTASRGNDFITGWTEVYVEAERLRAGFVQESCPNKLHLYCNIEHSAKNITFCRFQQTNSRAGYNVFDGLSDGTHSYYGEGFAKRHCGTTIEFPTASDYATWRCTVGVQEWNGTVIEQRTPLQALIRVMHAATRTRRSNKHIRVDGDVRSVFVQKDMSFTISCRADASLSYCWFQHPNGTQYTPTERASYDQSFWYSGESLQTGDCSITFGHASVDESGVWTCHMGPRDQVGVEYTDQVEVRVTGPLAAREKKVVAIIGQNATLYCHTSNGNRPLDYCRFLTPQFVGISIDSRVTKNNAILGRLFFTPGRDLNYGDCSLNISPVLAEDMGEWTCAGLVDEEILESRDTIQLFTEADSRRFQASVIGISLGAVVLIVAFVGVLSYRNRTRLTIPWRRTNNTERTDNISLDMRSDRLSLGSDISATVTNDGRTLPS